MEEVKEAVWDCDNSKCPGPNGFNFRFIKTFWNLIGGDFTRYINEFHAHGIIPRGCNWSFISLITKVDIPPHLGEYRPISLMGCMYKVLSKLLSNRMKKVLPKVI